MSTQTAVTAAPAPKPIETVRAALEKMKPQFAAVLPKHVTPERLCRVALTAIQQTPKLLECDKTSLYGAIMRAAQLGLEPDGILGQAYLIPYAGKVQFIPGYRGLIDLARRSGEVSNIIAKEVCEHDTFTVDWASDIPFHHTPKLDGDRGKITHFWALARFKDGGFHWDYLTAQEVLTIRDQSSGWQSAKKYNKTAESPWEKHYVEMGKKTAIRRIAKYLPMSVQRAAAVEDLVDANKKFSVDDYGDISLEPDDKTIDASTEEPTSAPQRTKKLDNFAGVDPKTGEIHDDIAGQNAAAAASEPEGLKLPPMDTPEEARQIGEQLVIVLKALDPADRSSGFVQSGGMAVVEALRQHGQGQIVQKFKSLGISIPDAQAA